MDKLEELKKLQKGIILLNQSLALLQWDMEVNLPEEGSQTRAEQTSLLSSLVHEKFTSDRLYNLAKELEKEDLNETDAVMIKRLIHDIERERKLPQEFVQELSRVSSRAFSSWKKAREMDDFSIFEKDLAKIVELKRKEVEYLGYSAHPYDALLDKFEEGMTTEKVSKIFDDLKLKLVSLIKEIEASEEYNNEENFELNADAFDKDRQFQLARDASERIGLKSSFSRMDISPHPFMTSLGSKDIRITTGIRENPLFSFESTIHESGHALYESNFPEDLDFSVLHDAPSYGIHESQSRFWENMVGKGKPFWRFYFEKFNGLIKDADFETFYKWLNKVTPGFIRIESDELHYCLHIILRFEVEKGLLEGSIEVKDLPRVWNEKFRESFGVAPGKASEGVLQDVHWSGGAFGYFPSYAIGTIYAAQIYEALKKETPEVEEEISRGELSRIGKWLKEKVHRHGRKLLAEEIISEVCGEGLNPDSYVNYLKKKYSEIYNLG